MSVQQQTANSPRKTYTRLIQSSTEHGWFRVQQKIHNSLPPVKFKNWMFPPVKKSSLNVAPDLIHMVNWYLWSTIQYRELYRPFWGDGAGDICHCQYQNKREATTGHLFLESINRHFWNKTGTPESMEWEAVLSDSPVLDCG